MPTFGKHMKLQVLVHFSQSVASARRWRVAFRFFGDA